MNQYRLTPEQAIEQDARYYNRRADLAERLAFDLDPDRHTPAEFLKPLSKDHCMAIVWDGWFCQEPRYAHSYCKAHVRQHCTGEQYINQAWVPCEPCVELKAERMREYATGSS